MRRAIRILAAVGLVLALAAGVLAGQTMLNSAPSGLVPPPPGSLRVATHNVHYIRLNAAEGAWSVADWNRRKGALDAAFKAADADIAAFQEMESFAGGDESRVNLALDWLLARNPGHAAAAVGDPAAFPSTQPILYRRDRLALRDQGWFFFSETPGVIYSRTFDGSYPSFASWARLAERRTGREVTVVNVHFDYRSRENRRRSAALVADWVAARIAAGDRVILAGDLNALGGSSLHRVLEDAGVGFLPVRGATFHFNRGLNLFGAIDHLAHGPGVVPQGAPMVLRARFDGVWPSDHYPVIADFRLE